MCNAERTLAYFVPNEARAPYLQWRIFPSPPSRRRACLCLATVPTLHFLNARPVQTSVLTPSADQGSPPAVRHHVHCPSHREGMDQIILAPVRCRVIVSKPTGTNDGRGHSACSWGARLADGNCVLAVAPPWQQLTHYGTATVWGRLPCGVMRSMTAGRSRASS